MDANRAAVGGTVGFGWIAFNATLSGWWDLSSDAHARARSAFFVNLAYEGCVGQLAVIAEAEARNWSVRIMEEPLHWCHAPTGLSDWVHVNVSPPLPFSTENENAAFIGFDAAGCMVRWESANGAGSTCPDG